MWSSRHSAKKHYLSGALPFNQKIESKIIRKFRQKSVRRLLPVSRGTFQRYSSIYVVWTVGTGEISVPFITEFPVSSFLIKRKRSALSFDCFANFWKKKNLTITIGSFWQILSNPAQQSCWKNCSTHQIRHSLNDLWFLDSNTDGDCIYGFKACHVFKILRPSLHENYHVFCVQNVFS